MIKIRDLLSAFGLGQKKIQQLLNKEGGAKLEELLSEEETIAECRNQNTKLLEYLSQEENLKQLIKYIIEDPVDPTDKDASYKFPFVSSDILSSSYKLAEAITKSGERQVEKKKETSVEKKKVDTEGEVESDIKIVQNMLQKSKQEQSDTNKDEKKECLVEEIDQEFENDEDQFAALNGDASGVEEKHNKKVTDRNSFTDKLVEENNLQDTKEKKDIEEEESKENVEADNGNDINKEVQQINICELSKNKLSQEEQKENEQNDEEVERDYENLDYLFSFLDQKKDLQPILCGYFCKVVVSLLSKSKQQMFSYIFNHRKGDVYNRLLDKLQHHSLAQLMIDLLELQVVATNEQERNRQQNNEMEWDKEDKNDEEEVEPKLTAIEAKQQAILEQKQRETITVLIRRLSRTNQDYELTLNSQTILNEISENEHTYSKLIAREQIEVLIESVCDHQNPNISFATNVLNNIIKNFSDYEKSVGEQLAQDFQQIMAQHFFDITYSCLLLIRENQSQDQDYINQTGQINKKIGIHRVRALELIRQEMKSLAKYVDLNSEQHINKILRRHILTTMLQVIADYPFSSIASQQALAILDALSRAFDKGDYKQICDFIIKQFNERRRYTFESGNWTTDSSLSQIIQMSFELQKLINLNPELIDEDYRRFQAENVLFKDEQEKWTKKLEDYNRDQVNNQESQEEEYNNSPHHEDLPEEEKKQEDEESELLSQNVLNIASKKLQGLKQRNLSLQQNKSQREEELKKLLEIDELDDKRKSKDDWEIRKLLESTYNDSNFWKLPEQYTIEQLMDEDKKNK